MIRKMTLVLAVFALSLWNVNAQKAANNWYFGNHARIDFNTTVPTATAVTTINTGEGCSAISDSNGNPLFYTDGIRVWDKNNNQMPNGFGLKGSPSSTHSALIVPCSCDKYFIFTTSAAEPPNSYQDGLQYSVVDMNAITNPGLGDVTVKNVQLLPYASEKVAGVADGTGGFWVVGHEMGNNNFFSYNVVAGGGCTLDSKAAVVSKVGSSFSGGTAGFGLGQMKFSPDGKWLAVAGTNYQSTPISFVELFKFDTSSGAVGDVNTGSTTRDTSTDGFYGVEFSRNSQYLYATTMVNTNYLYRYTVPTLPGSTTINNYGPAQYTLGALQLAPNGTIYLARKNQPYLDVLPTPDSGGGWTGAHFNLATGSLSLLGLPTVVAGDFSCAPPCGTITEPRVICDHGVFTYTFTVTNNTTQQIEWLLFSPPLNATYSISPPYIHLGTPLAANGGHTTVSVTINNASPGDHICLNVALADKDVVSCCTVQTCFDLCPCLKISDARVVCGHGPNSYTFTATIQNLTGAIVQQLVVVPTQPSNVNVTLSSASLPIPINGTATVTGTITGAGAQPGALVCLRFVPFGTEAQCCSTKVCFDHPLPICHHGPPGPPPPPDQPNAKKRKK